MLKICQYCSAKYNANGSRKYCSVDCSRKGQRKRAADRKRETDKVKPSMSVTLVAALARKNGMSYGQYVQQMEGRG